VSAGFTRAEVCAVALAECFRGDGERLVSPFGAVPSAGARLARLTFEPDLLLTDGIASLRADTPPLSGPQPDAALVEGWLPFRSVFDLLWSGRRHVVMAASQLDRFGNQNLACIGPHAKPRVQLLGMRGAPGNTLHHRTSYWIPDHGPKVFVPRVDVVCGVGNDRARQLGRAARFHDLHRVVSNLGVFDFATPDGSLRLVSVHPGVRVQTVVERTGFELAIGSDVPETRAPTPEERTLLREVIDPEGATQREVGD